MSLTPSWGRSENRTGPITVLAVADSADRVRMSVAMLDPLSGGGNTVGLAVVRSETTPSPARIRAETEGTRQAGLRVPVLTGRQIRKLVLRRRPDVVVLNCDGPFVEALSWSTRSIVRRYRPVAVSALPGLAVPAAEGTWLHRSRVDLLVAHSHREVSEYAALGEKLGIAGEVGLGSLPLDRHEGAGPTRRTRVVYAALPGVPEAERGRESILLALSEVARYRPELEVVVHVGYEGEAPGGHLDTWRALTASGSAPESALLFRSGALSTQLEGARGLVAVGSAAVLEAIENRVPALVLTDFGVGAAQGNAAFEGSGLFGTLADVRATRFHKPGRVWGEHNHFHPADHNDWVERLHGLLERADRGDLA
ncbi:DUF6716 putative glycosyltransferase [Nocardiopsis oceani]